jgi:hypothetical protein
MTLGDEIRQGFRVLAYHVAGHAIVNAYIELPFKIVGLTCVHISWFAICAILLLWLSFGFRLEAQTAIYATFTAGKLNVPGTDWIYGGQAGIYGCVGYSCTGVQPPGSNVLIAVAMFVVSCPKSFCSTTPSWLTMKVITPELPYIAG